MQDQLRSRISERFVCDIPVLACDTLENHPARVVDLSVHGAKVHCDRVWAPGETIHLDIAGDWTWGKVQWSEVDRMGIKFVTPLAPASALGAMLRQAGRPAPRATPTPAIRGFGRRAA